MKTDIVTLCHSATVVNQQLSMLGAFDTIIAPRFPHPFPPFSVAVRARFDAGEEGKRNLILRVINPDGKISAEMKVGLSLSREQFRPKATLCMVFPVTGMDLFCPGEYAIDLILDGNQPNRTPFFVCKA